VQGCKAVRLTALPQVLRVVQWVPGKCRGPLWHFCNLLQIKRANILATAWERTIFDIFRGFTSKCSINSITTTNDIQHKAAKAKSGHPTQNFEHILFHIWSWICRLRVSAMPSVPLWSHMAKHKHDGQWGLKIHYDTLQIAVKNPGLKHVANKEAGFTPGQPESVKIASRQLQHSSTPKKSKEDIQTGWCGLRQH